MKCICVTGAIQNDLDLAFNILQQAGIKSTQPNERNELIDMQTWHEQALSLDTDSLTENTAAFNPGRFMEQMASDIFVANIKSTAWGWADTRSTGLLDYWLAFDPRINFVLVYTSPEQMLARAISSSTENISVEDIMVAWQSHNQQLLRFYLRNPNRSLLIDGCEAIAKPQALLNLCKQQWSLKLATYPVRYVAFKTNDDTLALYLAQQLCMTYPEVDDLNNEIVATMLRLTNEEPTINSPSLVGQELIKSYRALQDRTAERKQLDDKEEALSALKVLFDKQKKQTELDDLNIRALIQDHDEQDEALQLKIDTLIQTIDDYDKSNRDLKDSLVKLQEETESRLKVSAKEYEALTQSKLAVEQEKTSLIQSHDALSNELKATQQVRDQQTRLATELQPQIEQLTQELANALAAYTKQKQETQAQQQNAQEENEVLLLQLNQVQEELESYYLRSEAGQTQLEALTKAKAAIEQEKTALLQSRDSLSNELKATQQVRDQQAQQAIERQKGIDALTQERDQFAKKLAERQTQLEALTKAKAAIEQEKTALLQSSDTLSNELKATQQARDQQTQLATERQAHIDAATLERDQFAEQAAERQKQLEALTQTLEQQELSIIHSNTERDQLQVQLNQQEDVMIKLKDQYSESDMRQRLLNDEMLKAEAQLELIKDVLLREPGL